MRRAKSLVRSKAQLTLPPATPEQLRDIEYEKRHLLYTEKRNVQELRRMCIANHLTVTEKSKTKPKGRDLLPKESLIAKVAEARVLGPLPPCPRCEDEGRYHEVTKVPTGRLVFNLKTGETHCNGGRHHRQVGGRWEIQACQGPKPSMIGTSRLARQPYTPIDKVELDHLKSVKHGDQYQNGVHPEIAASYISSVDKEIDDIMAAWDAQEGEEDSDW